MHVPARRRTKESNLPQPSHPLLLLLLNAYFVLALQPAEGQRKLRPFIVEIGETHLVKLMCAAFITDRIRKAR